MKIRYWLALAGVLPAFAYAQVPPGMGSSGGAGSYALLQQLQAALNNEIARAENAETSLSNRIGGATASAPVNTALPVISGTVAVGNVLTVNNGAWTNAPTSYAYQWRRNGTAITGSTASYYTVAAADEGDTLTVLETATNSAGSTSATSAATITVPTPSVPPAPGAPVLVAGVNSVQVTGPTVTATPAVTGYNVLASTATGGEVSVATNVTYPYTITGLTAGQIEYVKLQAVSSSGTSASSVEASATPIAPAAGQILIGTTPFTWSNQGIATVSGGGANPLVLASAADGNSTNVHALGTPMSTGTYDMQVSSNVPNYNYYQAGMALYNSANTNIATFLAPLFQSSSGATYAGLYYTGYQAQGQTGYGTSGTESYMATGQSFWLRTVNDGTNITQLSSANGAANSWTSLGTISLATLGSPNMVGPYIDAVDDGGAGASETFSVAGFYQSSSTSVQAVSVGLPAGAPAAPGAPTLVAGNTTVQVTGPTVSANPAVSGYNVLASTTSGNEVAVASNTALPYTITGLTNGAVEYVKLQAINSSGPSPSSVEASATPVVPPPQGSYSYTADVNQSSNPMVAALDPTMPVGTAALVAGTPGIQVDSSNNVLAVEDPVSGAIYNHGYGAALYVPASGNVPAHFLDTGAQNNGGYDAVVLPNANAAQIIAPYNQPFNAVYVVKFTASGGNDMLAMNNSGTNWNFEKHSGASDGTLDINQNNGTAAASETSGSLTALNQLQVVTFRADSHGYYIYRGVTNTAATTGTPQGGLTGTNKFEFFNQCGCEIYRTDLYLGDLGNAGLTTLIKSLESKYGIAVDSGSVSVGSSSAVAYTPYAPPTAAQTFSNYITNSGSQTTGGPAVYPSAVDPTDQTVYPVGWASGDDSNLTNKLSLVFGANNQSTYSPNCATCVITTRAQMDSHVEHNQIDGTAGSNVGGPKNQNSAFIAEFFSYPAGDLHDTTVVTPAGLVFHAYCAGGSPAGSSCQGGGGSGNIVSGIVRPETQIVPGDVVEVCSQDPAGSASWFTHWITGGAYPPAGSQTDFSWAYQGNGYPYTPKNYLENDFPDGEALNDNTSPVHDLLADIVSLSSTGTGNDSIQGAPYSSTPLNFVASSGGFAWTHGGGGHGYSVSTTLDRSAAVNCYQTYIYPASYSGVSTSSGADTTNATVTTMGHILNMLNGTIYQDIGDNWNGGQTLSWNNQPVATVPAAVLHVALQYGPTFLGNSVAAMTPAGVAADTATVRSIRIWHRNVTTAPMAPTLCNGVVPPTGPANSTDQTNSSCGAAPPFFIPTSIQQATAAQAPPSGAHEATFGSSGAITATPVASEFPPSNAAVVMTATVAPTSTDYSTSGNVGLIGKWGSNAQSSIWLLINGGKLLAAWTDGNTYNVVSSSVALTPAPGVFTKYEADMNLQTGAVTFWQTPVSSGTRTQIGAAESGTAGVQIPFNTTGSFVLGNFNGGGAPLTGSMSAASISANGTLLLNPVMIATGVSDSTGATWTANGYVGFQ